MASDAVYLDEPLLEDVLRTPYFFNGRLLTQEDLTQEQAAQRARRSHLGRALGTGVAYGLEVVPDPASSLPGEIVLDVAPGLAVTPDGDTLHLPEFVRLHFLVRPDSGGTFTRAADDFADCGRNVTSVSAAGSGLHLLVIRCASGKQGLAPVSGLGNEAAPCNIKYRTSGVGFRAFGLGTPLVRTDALFRSKFALECFGFFDQALGDALVDPLNGPAPLETPVRPVPGVVPAAGYGKLDQLRGTGELARCEVPLAIVHLRDNGLLDFVDPWPVRRSLVRPALTRRFWPFGGSDDRRRAEAEAAMLCFQDHVEAIPAAPELASATAESRFAFLPGGGFLPVGDGRFDAPTFFGPNATEVVDADFGRLRTLVEESWRCDAIDLSPGSRPPITYFVFAQAGGAWVFFLRRKTELPVIVDDPDELSPPETVAAAPGTGTPSGAILTTGGLLVIVTANWISKHGVPRVQLGKVTPKMEIHEIDAGDARELLKKEFREESTGLRKAKAVRKTPAKTPVEAFTNARFFFADDVRAGAYRVFIETRGLREFSQTSNTSVVAGEIALVTVT